MTEKPLTDVWRVRDFLVLVEVTRRIDSGTSTVRPTEVAAALGITEEEVQRAGAALARRGLVHIRGADQLPVIFFYDVSGEAYLMTGLHPDGQDALTRLVSALNQAAERSMDPDERSGLRRAADSLLSLPSAVAGGVMTAYLTGMLPGH